MKTKQNAVIFINKGTFKPLIFGVMLFIAGISAAQETSQAVYLRRFQNGTQLYNSSHWFESAAEFRRAQEISTNISDWSQALYWVILSELAYSDYGSAIRDMDELERTAPVSDFTRDMMYHRGRVYYNQGYFDDALLYFRRYINSVQNTYPENADRIAAAYFWTGECLYSMMQYDDALRFYTWVIDKYPESPKTEISAYRVDLIKQKKIEAELLALLQWSHEESLKTNEDYQRRIRSYEQALNSYQRRIAELSSGTSTSQNYDNRQMEDFSVYQDINSQNSWQSLYDRLLERAKQLNIELDILINEYINGGSL
jgi:TolA-binding protein